jgi:dihydrofolate reductase
MRKLYSFTVVTLDGFYEGPDGEFDWPNVDQEFNEFGIEQLHDTDLLLFGRVTYDSPNLTVSLIGLGLVDELRVMVHPIVLGAGHSLFRTARDRLRLELLQTRTFSSGNVLLTYRPV